MNGHPTSQKAEVDNDARLASPLVLSRLLLVLLLALLLLMLLLVPLLVLLHVVERRTMLSPASRPPPSGIATQPFFSPDFSDPDPDSVVVAAHL